MEEVAKDWKMRLIDEYTYVKERYNKLHSAIIKREAGVLDIDPKESLDIWKRQETAMISYLYMLEIRMVVNGIGVPKV